MRNAEIVAEELRGRMLSLYERHLSADGKAVSYKALKRDPAFWEYVDATAELQRVREGRGVGGASHHHRVTCASRLNVQKQRVQPGGA